LYKEFEFQKNNNEAPFWFVTLLPKCYLFYFKKVTG
jgi:hypothetical protein